MRYGIALRDDENKMITKKFYIDRWLDGASGAETLEEAREKIQERIDEDPFNTKPFYVLELKEAIRSKPVAETQVETIDIDGWISEQKQLQEKTDV